MSEFQKIILDHKSRKRAEQEAGERRRLLEDQQRQKALSVLTAIVFPVVKGAERELNSVNDSRSASVKQRLEAYSAPSVELSFRISSDEHCLPSTLQFSHTGDLMNVAGKIRSYNDRNSHDSSDQWQLADVSENLVQSAVVAFIKAVCEAD